MGSVQLRQLKSKMEPVIDSNNGDYHSSSQDFISVIREMTGASHAESARIARSLDFCLRSQCRSYHVSPEK